MWVYTDKLSPSIFSIVIIASDYLRVRNLTFIMSIVLLAISYYNSLDFSFSFTHLELIVTINRHLSIKYDAIIFSSIAGPNLFTKRRSESGKRGV